MAGEGPPAGAPVSYSRQYRRCGKPGCAVCGPGKPGHGPYRYAYWREGGRTRSRYLGRQAASAARERGDDPQPGPPVSAIQSQLSPAPQPGIRVRTLGGFAVRIGDEEVPDAR